MLTYISHFLYTLKHYNFFSLPICVCFCFYYYYFESFSWCDFVINVVAIVICVPQFVEISLLFLQLTTFVIAYAFVGGRTTTTHTYNTYLNIYLPSLRILIGQLATLMYNNFSSTGFEWRYSIAFLVIHLIIIFV